MKNSMLEKYLGLTVNALILQGGNPDFVGWKKGKIIEGENVKDALFLKDEETNLHFLGDYIQVIGAVYCPKCETRTGFGSDKSGEVILYSCQNPECQKITMIQLPEGFDPDAGTIKELNDGKVNLFKISGINSDPFDQIRETLKNSVQDAIEGAQKLGSALKESAGSRLPFPWEGNYSAEIEVPKIKELFDSAFGTNELPNPIMRQIQANEEFNRLMEGSNLKFAESSPIRDSHLPGILHTIILMNPDLPADVIAANLFDHFKSHLPFYLEPVDPDRGRLLEGIRNEIRNLLFDEGKDFNPDFSEVLDLERAANWIYEAWKARGRSETLFVITEEWFRITSPEFFQESDAKFEFKKDRENIFQIIGIADKTFNLGLTVNPADCLTDRGVIFGSRLEFTLSEDFSGWISFTLESTPGSFWEPPSVDEVPIIADPIPAIECAIQTIGRIVMETVDNLFRDAKESELEEEIQALGARMKEDPANRWQIEKDSEMMPDSILQKIQEPEKGFVELSDLNEEGGTAAARIAARENFPFSQEWEQNYLDSIKPDGLNRKIRIVKESINSPGSWFNKHIGEVFDVIRSDGANYTVDVDDILTLGTSIAFVPVTCAKLVNLCRGECGAELSEGDLCSDCQIVEFQEKTKSPDPENDFRDEPLGGFDADQVELD